MMNGILMNSLLVSKLFEPAGDHDLQPWMYPKRLRQFTLQNQDGHNNCHFSGLKPSSFHCFFRFGT